MAWTQSIDLQANCLVVVHREPHDMAEIFEHLQQLSQNSDIADGVNILRDLRGVMPPPEISFDFLIQTRPDAMNTDKMLGNRRYAMVVEGIVGIGIARQINIVMDGSPVKRRAFTDMRKAKRWLGLPEDYRLDLVPNDP